MANNPADERKLTGTGSYNIDNELDNISSVYKPSAAAAIQPPRSTSVVAQDPDDDDDDNYSSDEFESDDEEESESSIVLDGCSGSTVDTSAHKSSQAANQASQ